MGIGQSKKRPAKKEGFYARMMEIKRNAAKKVPATNEAAKNKAAKGKKETLSKGVDASKKKILVAKGKKEKLLIKPIKLKSFQIDGINIQRKTEGKKVTFLVGGKPINLIVWIQKRTKEHEKKQIDTALKPYAAFFKKVELSEKDRALKLKRLTDKIKARGAVSLGLISQAAQLSQLALTQKNPTQYSIRSTLKLHYGRILPPKVDTMIIRRPDGTKIVCMRDDGVPGSPYRDLATLQVIYPKKGDLIDVVRVSPPKAELMAKKEKSKNKKKKLSYGGYSGGGGGHGGGGGYSGLHSSSVPPSSSYLKPTSGVDLSKVSIEKTPEGWPKSLSVSHIEMPTKRLYCTLITPKRKPKPGERIVKIGYLTGKGKSNNYTKWREGPGKMKPPPIVAEAITKKYFSSEAKKAVAQWQAKMAKSGIYPVIAFMSEVHTKSKNPSSSWYRDWRKPAVVQNIFNNVFQAVEKAVPTDSKGKKIKHDRKIALFGHSMAGRPLKETATSLSKGKLKNVKVILFGNADSGYWNPDSQMYLAENYGTKLYVTSRKGTRTAKQAFRVIKKFALIDSSGKTPKDAVQMKNDTYTSSKYPNVVVKIDNLGHGKHPRFIEDAMAHVLASKKRFKTA